MEFKTFHHYSSEGTFAAAERMSTSTDQWRTQTCRIVQLKAGIWLKSDGISRCFRWCSLKKCCYWITLKALFSSCRARCRSVNMGTTGTRWLGCSFTFINSFRIQLCWALVWVVLFESLRVKISVFSLWWYRLILKSLLTVQSFSWVVQHFLVHIELPQTPTSLPQSEVTVGTIWLVGG